MGNGQKNKNNQIRQFISACPRNCYSTCSLNVTVKNGRLCFIEAINQNRATSEGICLKGLSYIERVYSPNRIIHPLRKKDDGRFEQIGWDEALGIITSRLKQYKKEYGPQSVLYYSGSGTKGLLNGVGQNFWKLYGGCTTTYGDLCWPAGLEATRLTLGENKHNAPWDLANARLIIMWGKNTAETNIHQMVFVNQALDNGAKLVVIDPRRTETSERAHLHIQPRPGTDGALALAVANLLIKNKTIDADFIKKYVLGFDAFAQMAERYSTEKAAAVCGIPDSFIEKMADLIATIKPLTINAGFGMQRYTNSGQTVRAIISLLALSGNVGKEGAGWVYANLQSQIFDSVKDPLAFYPPADTSGPFRVSISTSKLGHDILKTVDPQIKMLWVERGNPVTQNPDTSTVLKAFRSVEFKVVVEQFMTDTASEADIILPAKTMFEQSDVINAYWHSYIQLKQKIIEPPEQVKPETEIYYLLAKKLGFNEADLAGKIPAPTDQAVEAYLEEKLNLFPGINLEKLKHGPVPAPGTEEVAFSDLKFATPSGKIELFSAEAKERWAVDPLPEFKEADESALSLQDVNKKYSFYLMTPNTKNRIHSQFNNLKLIREISPGPQVLIHPRDAGPRGIENDDKVRVFNDRGYVEIKARLTLSIKPGCLSITNGWWISQGGTVNFCSLGRETDMGFGAAFHDNLVDVRNI